MTVRRTLIHALMLAAVAGPAAAIDVEAIPLRYRTLDQILPALQPLVETGGTVSGSATHVIIRTNPRNLIQLKKVLQAIDIPYRRLMISVRQSKDARAMQEGTSAGVAGRVYSSRAASDEAIFQQIQTIDGAPAFIAIGASVPQQNQSVVPTANGYAVTQSTTMRNFASGFTVVPRVVGDAVTIQIQPKREVMGNGPSGRIDSHRMAATVAGRLGQWIRVGGTATAADQDDRRRLSSASASGSEQRSVWLKVDEVP